MAGIYLHIPFCKQACHYCDFHFSTNTSMMDDMVEALKHEILLQQQYLQNQPVETIYFGGGTPSMLPSLRIKELLNLIREKFPVKDPEVTLEANPDDLNPAKLRELRLAGVNRLSIGIQSFQDDVLKFLNRAHNSSSALECVRDSRAAGFDNISIDLIYAIPGQTEDAWKKNIEQALALNPEHISSYSLTIEEKTVFGKWSAAGKLKNISDDQSATQLEMLVDLLEKAGYHQYEVSNFCRPGFESKHNSSYWKRKFYLGVGPGAHSYNGSSRQFNVRNNHLYLQSLKRNIIPFEIENLSGSDQINDYLMTTLRTTWGTDLKVLSEEFGYDVLKAHKGYIASLLSTGLAIVENDFLILTKRGKMMADKIASDLFSED